MIKNNREKEVLESIIDYYLNYGEAIGSRTLVKKYKLDASPATIRNVMSDLEELGYIEKVHSSSGRAPTSKGYKYYIDYLLEVQKLTEQEINRIKGRYERKTRELEFILSRSVSLLSEMTNYLGLALEPDITKEKLKKIEFVHLDEFTILALIITENLSVKTKKINLDRAITVQELNEISERLNASLRGNKISNLLANEEISEINPNLIRECFSDMETNLYLKQNVKSEILRNEISINVNNVREELKFFLESLVKNKKLDKNKINILLGEDIDLEVLKDFSIVCSSYEFGSSKGIIGVIGPKRMEYSKVMSLVEYVAKEVSDLGKKK